MIKLMLGVCLVYLLTSAGVAGQVPERRATESLRLGGAGSKAPAEAFVRRPVLVVDADGRIFARTASEVRVFRRDGTHLATLGGSGDGPGEFDATSGHGLLADTLWVASIRPARLSLFTVSAGHIETASRPSHASDDPDLEWRLQALLDGGRAVWQADVPDRGRRSLPGRVATRIGISDRVRPPKDPLLTKLEPGGLFVPSVAQFRLEPFPTAPLIAIEPWGRGIALVDWDPLRSTVPIVRRLDSRGATEFEVALPIRVSEVPRQVSDSLIDLGLAVLTPVAERARRAGHRVPTDLRRAVEEGLPIPDYYPTFQEVVAGVDGSTWVRRMRGFEDRTWLVLGGGGEVLFSVALPEGFELGQATLSSVWGTTVDEYDVPVILRLDIS